MAQRFPARAKNHAPRQKRQWSLFSQGGLPPFQPGDPFATASLCGNKERRFLKLSPGPFCLRLLLSCPGQQENGSERPTAWEMTCFLSPGTLIFSATQTSGGSASSSRQD